MTLEEVKSYLHIDPDLTGDDATLTSLVAAAQAYLTSATGKAYTDSDLQKTYICLYVKQVYEVDNSPVLTSAMHAILSAIKIGTEFPTVDTVEEAAAPDSTSDSGTGDTGEAGA